MDVSLFDFELPEAAIAQRPVTRGTARLMTLDRTTGAVAHRSVADLPALLRAGDVLVLNDTKVIPARIFGTDERAGGPSSCWFRESPETRASPGKTREKSGAASRSRGGG